MPLASLALSKIASCIKRRCELFIIEITCDSEGELITYKYCPNRKNDLNNIQQRRKTAKKQTKIHGKV
jgi:hypothetical protein